MERLLPGASRGELLPRAQQQQNNTGHVGLWVVGGDVGEAAPATQPATGIRSTRHVGARRARVLRHISDAGQAGQPSCCSKLRARPHGRR